MDLILKVVSPESSAPGNASRYVFDETGGSIDRETDNSWVLPHIAGLHAEVTYANGIFYIGNTSQYDVFLNAGRLVPGETRRLNAGDQLLVGPYDLRVSMVDTAGLPPRAQDDAGRDLLEALAAIRKSSSKRSRNRTFKGDVSVVGYSH